MLMKLWQINIISLVNEFHYRLFSTNKVMTGNSLNRSLLCLPLKKDLLKSSSLTLQDTSCSLISCLQLRSRSQLQLERGGKPATTKATPPIEVPVPSKPLLVHGLSIPATRPHRVSADAYLTLASSHPPTVLWPQIWIFTHQHPDNLRSLRCLQLFSPGSRLIFTVSHPLDHSSVTIIKRAATNHFSNYKNPTHLSDTAGARNWHFPTWKISSISNSRGLQQLPRPKSLACIFYMHSLWARKLVLLLQPRQPFSTYTMDVPATLGRHVVIDSCFHYSWNSLFTSLESLKGYF